MSPPTLGQRALYTFQLSHIYCEICVERGLLLGVLQGGLNALNIELGTQYIITKLYCFAWAGI